MFYKLTKIKMKNTRRNFIKKSAILGIAGATIPQFTFAKNETMTKTNENNSTRPKVLFFDVNETLLDLTVMKKSVGDALGGRKELLPLWFTTMLQYSLVSTVGRQYNDFGIIGSAALLMASL